MNIDFVFLILKYLAAVVTGAYGVYATVTDFYDERNGKRTLTKKGYIGICLLTLSVSAGLLADIVGDTRQRIAEKKAEKVARESREQQLKRQEHLLVILNEQIDNTRTISKNLKNTTQRVEATVATSNEILSEQLKRVEFLEVQLFVTVDPLAFQTREGISLLEPKLVEALKKEVSGEAELPVELFGPISLTLRENYELVRERVFSDWDLNVEFIHKKSDPSVWLFNSRSFRIRRQGNDGVGSFVISHVSEFDQFPQETPQGVVRSGVQCWINYLFPVNRSAGFRTWEDFNGSKLSIDLEANASLLNLTTIRMHLGVGGQRAVFIQNQDFSERSGGIWRADREIPEDQFGPQPRKQVHP